MTRTMNRVKIAAAALALCAAPSVFAQTTDTDTTTLSVTIAPEASITVNSSPTLAKGGTEFEDFTGDTTFTYLARTSETGGTGSITAQVTTAFAAASNITTGDLSYVVAGAGLGTPNGSSTTASEGSATAVISSFGADGHTSDAGDSATISWTLADRPAYTTGSYSTVVTLTISVT